MSFAKRRQLHKPVDQADPSGYTKLDVEDARQADNTRGNFRVMDISLALVVLAFAVVLLYFVVRGGG